MKKQLCNDNEEHEYWASQNTSCPICVAIKRNQLNAEQREKDLEKLAELIANKILEKLST
jgi:hypothetical protein